MFTFEIEFINAYCHVLNSSVITCETENQAIQAAKKEKDLFPGCHIEIICFETRKRIYA